MAGLKEIKTRIGSVTSTQQMTKAMKMVSVARLRSAQSRIFNLRNYANSLEEILKDVVMTEKVKHPFLEQKKPEDIKKVLIVVMTSDRGLCGGFNGNICRFTENHLKEFKNNEKVDLFFIGRKGSDYFKFRNKKGIEDPVLNIVKEISYPLAASISKNLMEKTIEGKYDAVYIIYNEFKTVITPRIVCERFLPFDLKSERLSKKESSSLSDLIFEVDPKELTNSLLERYFNIQIYRCLSENIAAEQGSRMAAMESATSNAEEMISKLTLKYNKVRQSAITTELTEIVAGVEALT